MELERNGKLDHSNATCLPDNLYFGTSDSHAFYCVDKDYGQVKWKLALSMRVYGSAVAKDSLIYFGCFNGKLYGVNYRTGGNCVAVSNRGQ